MSFNWIDVEGARLDLTGLQILPGLINAHDHLQFALFPRLGSGPYPNAGAWARDIYHPEKEPIRSLLGIPKPLRLLWGGLRNLLCGVTSVHHHDPYDPIFDADFPVRVVQCGWAHSLEFCDDVAARFAETPPGSPFVIHLGEGTDAAAEAEVFRLHDLGALDDHTVLVHAVGLSPKGWELVARAGASVVWCPGSNLFTLGRTLKRNTIPPEVPLALGSDSPLTVSGDLLDEIAFVRECDHVSPCHASRLVGEHAARILRIPPRPEDWIATPSFGEPPEIVVRDGRILLIRPERAGSLPADVRAKLFPLKVGRRPRVLVRCDTRKLFQETKNGAGEREVRLGNRNISVE